MNTQEAEELLMMWLADPSIPERQGAEKPHRGAVSAALKFVRWLSSDGAVLCGGPGGLGCVNVCVGSFGRVIVGGSVCDYVFTVEFRYDGSYLRTLWCSENGRRWVCDRESTDE